MPYVALAHAGRVHYAERGERRPGRPSAVLIHGAGASSAIWMMVLARVARAGHAVAIDLPGARAQQRRRDGARRFARADAGPLPRRGRRAGGHAVPRAVGAGRAFAGRAGRDRGGAGVARQGARPGAVRRRAAPARRPGAGTTAARRSDRACRPGWRSTRCRRARSRRSAAASWRRATSRRPTSRAPTSRSCATPTSARASARSACPVTWLDGADDRIVPAGRRRPARSSRCPTSAT